MSGPSLRQSLAEWRRLGRDARRVRSGRNSAPGYAPPASGSAAWKGAFSTRCCICEGHPMFRGSPALHMRDLKTDRWSWWPGSDITHASMPSPTRSERVRW